MILSDIQATILFAILIAFLFSVQIRMAKDREQIEKETLQDTPSQGKFLLVLGLASWASAALYAYKGRIYGPNYEIVQALQPERFWCIEVVALICGLYFLALGFLEKRRSS